MQLIGQLEALMQADLRNNLGTRAGDKCVASKAFACVCCFPTLCMPCLVTVLFACVGYGALGSPYLALHPREAPSLRPGVPCIAALCCLLQVMLTLTLRTFGSLFVEHIKFS